LGIFSEVSIKCLGEKDVQHFAEWIFLGPHRVIIFLFYLKRANKPVFKMIYNLFIQETFKENVLIMMLGAVRYAPVLSVSPYILLLWT